MKKELELLEIAKRLRALSQTGLYYSLSDYDTERYTELTELSDRITALLTDHTPLEVQQLFLPVKEYVTPKVDIRAVVFNENSEILMVREKADGLWSLPGGWSDVGYSPSEVAEKEVKEETGLKVKAEKLLAVLDMKKHDHPAIPFYVYKMFILCEIQGGAFSEAFDISGKGFFPVPELPPLSEERVTKAQIELMYEYYKNPQKEAIID